MMKRGSLIIYDEEGRIWVNTGDAEGDVLPHEHPKGLPYIETQFGELENKIVKRVNINTKTLITEERPVRMTAEDKIQELEDRLLLEKDRELGGIL